MPTNWPTILAVILGCVVVLNMGRRYLGNNKSRSLPPGPLGLPWIGNVIGIDPDAPWLTYTEWSKKYGTLLAIGQTFVSCIHANGLTGDLVYTRLFGRVVIIINSEAVAKDLLDNRSRNYSDRPFLITNELLVFPFTHYAATFNT